MSQRSALGPKEMPMLSGVPRMCPCKLVPFCSCWPPLPHYRSGVPALVIMYNSTRCICMPKQATQLLLVYKTLIKCSIDIIVLKDESAASFVTSVGREKYGVHVFFL